MNFVTHPHPLSCGYKYPDIYRDYPFLGRNLLVDDHQVGDVLLYSNATYEILEIHDHGDWTIRRITNSAPFYDGKLRIHPQMATCGVFRPSPNKPEAAAVSTAPAAATKIDDGYNGTCQSCGKRTYEGAWKLVHEGGPCQGARQ